MKKYEFLIVGAGLFGSTFAYMARKRGKKCIVIDKRPNIGGNLYCENIEGINVHKYGAHIFHTSNKKIWNFVNSIVEFNRYTNSPVANYRGKLYNLPFNMNTFYQIWGVTTPQEAIGKLEEQRAEAKKKLKGREPQNLEEQALLSIGKDIYEKLIKGYTEKQWGRGCKELPAFIIRRLPVRFVFDNNYFNDMYQGIPVGGYNRLINGLLGDIKIHLGCNYFDNRYELDNIAEKIIFTGPLDEFYDYKFGPLQYRTMSFETEILDIPNFQGNAVVNYTDINVSYTRIIEHKHFEMFGQAVNENHKTVISKEYSMEWQQGNEPYYPVNDKINNDLSKKYWTLAQKEKDVFFGGRLAEYKYYDMAPVIESAIRLFFNIMDIR